MYYLDLFAGIGGFALGAKWAGLQFDKHYFSEVDDYAIKVYQKRFPEAIGLGDITKIDGNLLPKGEWIIAGGFPCFPGGTKIRTPKGDVSIENIKTGDLVMTHLGRYRKVLNTMQREAQGTLKTRVFGSLPFEVTEEHPFYAIKKRLLWDNEKRRYVKTYSSPDWVLAKDLTNKHLLAQPLDKTIQQEDGETSFWYLVGRYLGDGWVANYKRTSKIPEGKRGSRVHSKTWKVIICTNKKDLELRQKIKDAGFSFSTSTERTVIKHHICSKDLVEKLIPFGKGAKGKKIPDYVFSISVEKKEALFRGWVDADGCTTKGRIQATTISKDLAEGMARIARSVFKRPVAIYKTEVPLEKKIEGRLVNQNTQYSVRVSKKPHGFCDDNYCWVPFREAIKVDRNLTVYNLEVKEDNSYVANGFAVHNCQDISIAGKGLGLDGERSGLWFEYARIIDELRPRYAVMENVGALTIRGIDSVLGSLAEIGYACEWQDIRASDVGAPHRRERIWIVAYAEQNGLSAD